MAHLGGTATWLRLSALAFVLAVAGCSSVPKAAKTRVGPHFEVICHFECGTMAAQALSAAERAWDYSALLYGEPETPVEKPLEIHLYYSSEDVNAVRERMRFDSGGSFADPDTRTAHVNAGASRLPKAALLYAGTPAPLLRTVAHEAAHLSSYQMAALRHALPRWLTEGSAEWIEQQVAVSMGLAAPHEEDDPDASMRIFRAQRMLENGTLRDAASILRDDWGDLGTYNQYTLRWLLFTMLYGSEAYHPTLATLIQKEQTAQSGAQSAYSPSAQYFPPDLPRLNRDFRAFVQSFQPKWTTQRTRLETGGDTWLQLTYAPKGAAWRRDSIPHRTYALSGQLEIIPSTGRQMNILIGPAGSADSTWRGVKVAFVANRGVRVLRHAGGAGDATRWTPVDSAEAKTLRAGARLPFRIARTADRLRVSVGGAALTDTPLAPAPGGERWALGGEHGTAGIWRSLRVEPLNPAAPSSNTDATSRTPRRGRTPVRPRP